MFTTSSAGTATPARQQGAWQGPRSPAQRKSRLPQKIGAALATVNEHPDLRALSLTTRNVLSFIIQVTDARDPFRSCFAHKATIADRLGIGEATVYRALNNLIGAGLLVRETQERKSMNGRYAVARIKLTKKCCVILGLVEDDNFVTDANNSVDDIANENGENNIHATSGCVCLAAGDIVLRNPANPEGETTPRAQHNDSRHEAGKPATPTCKVIDGHKDILPTADQQTQSRRDNRSIRGAQRPEQGKPSVRIPSEFFWLVESERLTAPAVCKLMRLFSARGQRLTDAVMVTRRHLLGIPKRRVYAYLATLARSESDFASQAKVLSEAAAAKQAAVAHKQRAVKLADMDGKWLVSSDRTKLIKLGGFHAEVFALASGVVQRGVATVNQLVEAYTSGRLTEIEPEDAEAMRRQWSTLN